MTEVFHLSPSISDARERKVISKAVKKSKLDEDVWVIFLSEIDEYKNRHQGSPLVVISELLTSQMIQLAARHGVNACVEFTTDVEVLTRRFNDASKT